MCVCVCVSVCVYRSYAEPFFFLSNDYFVLFFSMLSMALEDQTHHLQLCNALKQSFFFLTTLHMIFLHDCVPVLSFDASV